VKRSQTVRRVLLGGFSAGALVASSASAMAAEPRVTPDSYYPNDYQIAGVGYYHAPFRAFFPQPYNYYDPARKQYFYGGQWGPAPHRSIVNISSPTAEVAQRAESLRTDLQRPYVQRGGFGGTSHSHFIPS
jgi:hypothetical protein